MNIYEDYKVTCDICLNEEIILTAQDEDDLEVQLEKNGWFIQGYENDLVYVCPKCKKIFG